MPGAHPLFSRKGIGCEPGGNHLTSCERCSVVKMVKDVSTHRQFGRKVVGHLAGPIVIAIYRVHGGKASELGVFWSRTKPLGPLQASLDSALAPEFGNTARYWTEISIPPGQRFFEGKAAAVPTKTGEIPGHGNQIFLLENPPESWKTGSGEFR